MSEHLCHAVGCEVPVQPRLAMCRKHWFMVPLGLRRAVWSEYVPGQEVRKDPSRAYLDALNGAIGAVRDRELFS